MSGPLVPLRVRRAIGPVARRKRRLATIGDAPVDAHERRGDQTMSLDVAPLSRYPVQTLAGEPLTSAVIGEDGVTWDR